MFKKLTISSLVGVVTTLFSITTFSAESESVETHIANLVPDNKIYTVSANTTSNSAVLGGTVLPIKMVNLIAQMPGEVKFIAGEEGDRFEMGTTLVGLDRATLLEKRRAAVAGLRSAQAGLSNAQVQYTREKESPNAMGNSLLGGVPSMFTMFSDPMREFSGEGDPDYERYSSLYGQNIMIQTARDQIEQARAGIAELDANLENLQSIAPFKGIIVKKMVEEGDIVQPGMPLVVFADTSIMQIQVEVPARLISNINENSVVSARLDRGTTIIPAKVSRIFPMASQGGHTTTVKFELPVGTGARAGMYAEILIPTNGNAKKPLAVIPETAISWRGSLPAVFAVSADKTSLKMRSLRLGTSSGNGMISILSGVSIGDKILKQPLASTRSGPYTAVAQ
ncbi:MAG: efflux RND transporter periplasmic adaptor subunit [Gammaproteobacteria bacterium]|jgi:multidrug efflux pump subunit AcrA (membrane-fusion protein)|nr:efflux RND transporter periplasmic adaptor subunit [Gammaproteobacteria bacterium]MBT3725344.1 efflux RND transporter periplasmic adaptor subunit [Gammaproteobacteria bacterium]MBT4077697.1 efflux RND transporter periplasmic adaptor subunit [Gammaproteobacteria bacterium]MBT4195895.1 efflux RND transporter periplasmic adaptor subunit [Gammaproteobacteria bacterium]MBT4448410.1 efflux RND transporter periplasmic adaptor subunit [Gammaproteobacteria bacterium]